MSLTSQAAPRPEGAHASGIRRVLAFVEAQAPRDCARLGILQAEHMRLSSRAKAAGMDDESALASEAAAGIAALEVEIGLVLGALSARNGELARLRDALRP